MKHRGKPNWAQRAYAPAHGKAARPALPDSHAQLTDNQQHNKRLVKDALLQAERPPFTAQYVPFRHAVWHISINECPLRSHSLVVKGVKVIFYRS